ncbi:S8 family serine peptidase [Streptomyces gamaensis]|uniref:S8 family serine peptidase n=1 Tax=Streptomyces gamaensis TaxID=1763542 RepID=A0ABW0Z9D5_9ACTN
MWSVSQGEGITVAVVDSGVDPSVPELRGQVLQGADVSHAPAGAHTDSEGHGTEMAALIAGTGADGGLRGLAPRTKILPVRAKAAAGDAQDALMGRALRYAVEHGARVINVSMGGTGSGPDQFPRTQEAVNYALAKGSLVFAGVGNDGDKGNPVEFPAALPGVVGVGAVDKASTVTKFSNWGKQVALAAPGEEIPGRCRQSAGWCAQRGTSPATAIASASAALIWSAHPNWTNNQVLRVLMDTAGKPTTGTVPSKYIGYGTIRPRKVLLDSEGDPGPPDINPLLPAAQSPKPSTPQAPNDTTSAANPEPTRAEEDNTTLWLGLGIAAAIAAAAAAAAYAVRRRKSDRHTPDHNSTPTTHTHTYSRGEPDHVGHPENQ